jgi:hypothetical protein
MSITNIVRRILETLSAYEQGDVAASSIAQSVELHEPAMEAIPREMRDLLHQLSLKIIEEDVSPLEEEDLGLKASREGCEELRTLLQQIADLPSPN